MYFNTFWHTHNMEYQLAIKKKKLSNMFSVERSS